MYAQTILVLVAGLAPFAAGQATSGTARTTRYWDCCRPSSSWPGKASVSQPVKSCERNGSPAALTARSGCDSNGIAFTCSDNQPWAVNDNLSYGFAATAFSGQNEANWSCACYALKFTSGPVSGKTMVVQSTNTGGDLNGNHFDLLMPGGGLGIFDGCTPQFGFNFPGERYGGTTSLSQCDQLPEQLKAGCLWRYSWFQNANNPDVSWNRVRCPSELTSITGCRRNDDGNFPVFQAPSPGTTTTSTRATTSTTAPVNPPPTVTPPSPPTGGPAAPVWGQCGGTGWSGPVSCVSGSRCVVSNQWYSQCLPQ